MNQNTTGRQDPVDAHAPRRQPRPPGTPLQNRIIDAVERYTSLPEEDPERPALRAYLMCFEDVRQIIEDHERGKRIAGKLLGTVFRYDELPKLIFWIDSERGGWVWANTFTRLALRLPVAQDDHKRIFSLLVRQTAADKEVWDKCLSLIHDGLDGHSELYPELNVNVTADAPTPAEARP